MELTRVVLAGAGHGHLYTLRRAVEYARHGAALTLVAPGPLLYSGMASGVLGGSYAAGANVIDASGWVEAAGGTVIRDHVAGIDTRARLLHLSAGGTIPYDVLSLSIGSATTAPFPLAPASKGAAEAGTAWPVKPVDALAELHHRIVEHLRSGDRIRVVIAGGGASGCEVAGNVAALAASRGGRSEITLVEAGRSLLPGTAPGAAAAATRVLRSRGVVVQLADEIVGFDGAIVETRGGSTMPADFLVLATGQQPPPLLRATGLPCASDGSLIVDPFLRSTRDPRVFGVGDCVTLEGHDLPRVGVYAIRQAPVLHHNLLATAAGRGEMALRRFEPQKRYLLILNLGAATGLAVRGRLHWLGRAAWWLKDRIDRRFVEQYRAPRPERAGRTEATAAH